MEGSWVYGEQRLEGKIGGYKVRQMSYLHF